MFIQIPDSVYREHITTSATPTATISGGVLSAQVVEAEVAKIVRVQQQWKWEAVPHGANEFLVPFRPWRIFTVWLILSFGLNHMGLSYLSASGKSRISYPTSL